MQSYLEFKRENIVTLCLTLQFYADFNITVTFTKNPIKIDIDPLVLKNNLFIQL